MKNIKYQWVLCMSIVLFTFGACDDYLDVVPEEDLTTIESIFEKRQTAISYFYGCYNNYWFFGGNTALDPGMLGSDEYTTGEFLRNGKYSGNHNIPLFYNIASGLQGTTRPSMGYWTPFYQSIRQCNTFIENIDKVYNMTQEEKNQYKASAKAIKALFYFELMMQYGPITLVPENIDVEVPIEEMQVPRSHIDTCVASIVRLFDEAIELGIVYRNEQLPTEAGLLTREAVYAYKAKVLLWAASPLYNGNAWYANFKNRDGENLFSTDYDANKWKIAADAAQEAIEVCEVRNMKLYNEFTQERSELLIKIRNIQLSVLPIGFESPELLHGIPTGFGYNSMDLMMQCPRIYNPNGYSTPSTRYDGLQTPPLRMAELFYTKNGLPIDKDNSWRDEDIYKHGIEVSKEYEGVVALNRDLIQLHMKREPRFYANIGFDGGIWRNNGIDVELQAYKGGANGYSKSYKTNEPHNITGYWAKKFFHHSLNAWGEMSAYGPVAPFPKLRLAELYLMRAEALNEFLEAPSSEVYEAIDVVRERAGIPGVEDAWKNFSSESDKVTTKEGMRDIIRTERLIEFAFEGKRFWDLRRWKIAHSSMPPQLPVFSEIRGWNVYGTAGEGFYNNYAGPVKVWDKNIFTSTRDYLWPLSSSEVLKSNVVQNPGW